jgi:pyroglutamyl-peptidase
MVARTRAGAAGPAGAPGRPVLVTGFDPFGGEDVNPSWEICKALPTAIGRSSIERLLVPTAFGRAVEAVSGAITRFDPALVILLGQAGGRSAVCVERVAINVDDARIPDNAGAQPVDGAIAPTGPAAYFATVPIKAMVAAMREAGVPAEVSNTAGTFVCNHLLYGVLHFLATDGRGTRAGFIHVPWLDRQAIARPGEPSMALATMARGVEAAIAAALKAPIDVKMAAGKLD